MKNTRICPNCNTENDFIAYTCSSCQHYMRDKIVNIDLWSEFWNFLESPMQAFKKVVLAEHKNYLFILLFLIAIKLSINSIVIKSALELNPEVHRELFTNLMLNCGYVIIYFTVFSLIVNILVNSFGVKSKFKNILSSYVFAFWPLVFGLVILTAVEYAVFGHFFFTFNPSPLVIKPLAAYVVLILEGLVFISGIIYSILGLKVITNNIAFSIIFGVLIGTGLLSISLFLPLMPF